ncbi:Lecithin:cholesterol/phospholipid:diacylglycerol acyltransferase, partial [Absidia repens]
RDELGLEAHFPVIMIPGISSSIIESWGTSEKFKNYYRKRIWGTYDMIQLIITNKSAWFELMKLDPTTGLDPEGIKLRAAEGFDAAEYVLPGYWIWSKVLKNLSAIGYDTTNMYMASYDWRLSLELLEHRDRYFTKLKNRIEHNKRMFERRTVIIGHSMGSTVLHYFLKWVESSKGGNGGKQWTENHVENVVHIGGALLGTPKALTFLLSGGNKIWGDLNSAPDDMDNMENQTSFGEYLSFLPHHDTEIDDETRTDVITRPSSFSPLLNHTLDTTMTLMESMASPEFISSLHNNYSHGITSSKKQLEENDDIPRKWTNPLESKLPNAPSTTIYNLYGIGLPTERSYYFVTPDLTDLPIENDQCNAYGNTPTVSGDSTTIPLFIDSSVSNSTGNIELGIRLTDGDFTVPVISNGYMSSPLGGGWTEHADLYNPGHSQIIAREYQHKTTKGTLDLLQIVSGHGENVTERLYSNIEGMAQQISLVHQA